MLKTKSATPSPGGRQRRSRRGRRGDHQRRCEGRRRRPSARTRRGSTAGSPRASDSTRTRSRRASAASRGRRSRTSSSPRRRCADSPRHSARRCSISTSRRSPACASATGTSPWTASAAYVPGGRYPMVASAHMSIVTAKVAGVQRVAACTPPLRWPCAGRNHRGDARSPEPTRSTCSAACRQSRRWHSARRRSQPVDILAGPGNAYVVEAKRQLFGKVGIDLIAGPTEILIVADETADPSDCRRRPARPGRARPCFAGRARHDLPGRRVANAPPDRHPTRRPADGGHRRASVGGPWRGSGRRRRMTKRSSSPMRMHSSTSRSTRPSLTGTWSGCATTARSSSGRRRRSPTATSRSAPTTSSRPRGAARYTGGLWVGKFLKTVTYQECDEPASAVIGEVSARQSRIENFEGHARSCDVRVVKYAQTTVATRDGR